MIHFGHHSAHLVEDQIKIIPLTSGESMCSVWVMNNEQYDCWSINHSGLMTADTLNSPDETCNRLAFYTIVCVGADIFKWMNECILAFAALPYKDLLIFYRMQQ